MTDKDKIIKEGMMKLWKDTFHDSDEYIRLVFDVYFSPEMVEYEVKDGELAAAMLAVPYEFGSGDNRIRGAYLCGLATADKFRGMGVMSRLIERIAEKLKERGYAFLFLIPADEGLQLYYRDRRFVDAFYREKRRYTSVHDFILEYEHVLENEPERLRVVKERYCSRINCFKTSGCEPMNCRDYESLVDYMSLNDKSGMGLSIIHTREDLMAVIDECILSGGAIYYAKDGDDKITGVALVYICDDNITVYKLESENNCTRVRLLDSIKNDYPERGVEIYEYPQSYTKGIRPDVYGMARILNLHEILKFQATCRRDLKYSILVKNGENGEFVRYIAQNGTVSEKIERNVIDGSDMPRSEFMTEKEVAEILFRRPDSEPLLEQVIGLPALGGKISMMLD